MVIDSSSTTRHSSSASAAAGTTTQPPMVRVASARPSPATWKNGNTPSRRSSDVSDRPWARLALEASQARWERRQPLGLPVVPDV